jgi:lysophospholipase L1-like esterase
LRIAIAGLLFATVAVSAKAQQDDKLRTDWADLAHYRAANDSLGAPKDGERRVVFMGNSITEGWAPYFASHFANQPYVGRGISGQTTPQMLVRFRQDVISLRPTVVLILGGTNDIAGNTGPSSVGMIEDNLRSMTDIAKANGIKVLLGSVLPVYDYPWKRGLAPADTIRRLNQSIKAYADSVGVVYVDFYTPMSDERGGLRTELTRDGVHPNAEGYQVMSLIAGPIIERAQGHVRIR